MIFARVPETVLRASLKFGSGIETCDQVVAKE